MSAGGGRRLSDEDRALWANITRSIAPLRTKKSAPPDPAPAPAAARKPPAPVSHRASAPARGAASKGAPRLEPLDRRLKQRLARGTESLDARIDLHGRTQSEAHAALVRFLRRAQREEAKFVLVITGKGGRAGDAGGERGVLKRQVPQWLRLPEFRAYVVGFEAAHIGHGGEGALYVRIRKAGAKGR
jgi:DNA-nicking Smr family endonuclease